MGKPLFGLMGGSGNSIFSQSLNPDSPLDGVRVCYEGNCAVAKFGTVINCIDGRVQVPAMEYLKSLFDLDYVDMITEPGPVLLFADRQEEAISRILDKVAISADKHGSKCLAIAGHFDCAANPVNEEVQWQQILQAIGALKTLIGDKMQVLGLWVDEKWNVHRVSE